MLLAVMVVSWVATFAAIAQSRHAIHSEQVRADAIANSAQEQQVATLKLESRVSALEATGKSQLDPSKLAADSLPSVFVVQVISPLGADLGTGFVVSSANGTSELVTNFHVVANEWNTGGRHVVLRQRAAAYNGTILNVSQAQDLAIIRLDVPVDPLPLQQSPPAVGAPVVVIGSPMGLEGTVATGVVSANRSAYIQFSAPVSPGDSGGPVLNAQGEVVGITVSKVQARGAEGLSFAIPVSTLCTTLLDC